MLYDNHGRVCRKIGNRFYAIPKQMGIVEQIAARNGLRGSHWERRVESQKTGNRARVIVNATGRAMPRRQPRFGA